MKIENSKDFVAFMSETMEGVKAGNIEPAAGNAIANLGSKMLQMITLEMRVASYPKLASRTALKIEAN